MDLKPCPFCGQTPNAFPGPYCECVGEVYAHDAELWNDRAPSDPARESRIKAVVEAHRRLKGDKLATDEDREQAYHDREDALDALAAGEVKYD